MKKVVVLEESEGGAGIRHINEMKKIGNDDVRARPG